MSRPVDPIAQARLASALRTFPSKPSSLAVVGEYRSIHPDRPAVVLKPAF